MFCGQCQTRKEDETGTYQPQSPWTAYQKLNPMDIDSVVFNKKAHNDIFSGFAPQQDTTSRLFVRRRYLMDACLRFDMGEDWVFARMLVDK